MPGEDAGRLIIVNWNVRGIADLSFENFVTTLSSEVDWYICILQEFSGKKSGGRGSTWTTKDGHQVVQQAPGSGREIGGIIVHARNIIHIVKDSFSCAERAWSLDLLFAGEHGDYPVDELGRHMYPRKALFEQIAGVMAMTNKVVPVFNDKVPHCTATQRGCCCKRTGYMLINSKFTLRFSACLFTAFFLRHR